VSNRLLTARQSLEEKPAEEKPEADRGCQAIAFVLRGIPEVAKASEPAPALVHLQIVPESV